MKAFLSIMLILACTCASRAAAPAVGSISQNQSFARSSGSGFVNTNLDAYEGKILVIMLMTPWCPECQSISRAAGAGIPTYFDAASRGALAGKNDRGVPIQSILLSTEEASGWDATNNSFASTNGFKQWGLDANARRGNPRVLLGYLRGGFIADTDLHAWGNDRRRLFVVNLVRNSASHSYREIVINQNTYSASDNAGARAAINAIRPAPVITPPTITSDPASITIASGSTATLRASASGTSPAFQWYIGASGVTSNPIAGATTAVYTTPALVSNTTYWVRASNASGSDDSKAAIVTVTPPPPATTTFSQWLAGYSFPTGESGAKDDPDQDGVPNLLEYFHGSHPLQPTDASSLLSYTLSPAGGSLIYRRARNLSGLAVSYQSSGDLIQWTTSLDSSLGITVRDLGAAEEVTVTFPASTEPVTYYRLNVTAS